MMDTVPTPAEISGDFSQSGTTIYNPFSARANPNFDPTKPISAANRKSSAIPFRTTKFPPARLAPPHKPFC